MAGHRPVLAALAAIEAADAASQLDELPALVLPALADAFGADSLGWTVLLGPPDRARPRYHGYPRPLLAGAPGRLFERHLAELPLARHTRPGGAGTPLRRSDLQTRGEYHRSGMYAEVLRPLGVEEILAMSLRHADVHVCLSLHRRGRDFSDGAVALLGALRRPLARRMATLADAGEHRAVALTPRQREVLSLAGRGLTDVAIGHCLGCSPRTVDKHLEHVYRRLGARGRAEAVAIWLTGPPR